ncbi:hypothetical protein, partial [Dermabacter hominis]|uniref:ComF family protein n=1 Tax=Dermabacter hominis TaxID=36740 RepID=UPI003183FE91
ECASALSGGAIRVEEVCEGVCEARPSADGREIEALPMFPVVTLAEYEGRAKNLVLDYKNGGHFALAQYFGPLLADALAEFAERCAHRHILVAVPSRSEAVRRRGEDHMRLLAEHVSAHTRVRLAPALRLSGPSQHSRTKRERAAGRGRVIGPRRRERAAGRGRVIGPRRREEWEGLRGVSAVILDDVVTTGTTLKKTSDALAGLGVPTCAALTLASARVPRTHVPSLLV